MASKLLSYAVLFGSLALMCGIASLLTTEWIKGCAPISNVLEVYGPTPNDKSFQISESVLNEMKRMKVCLKSGIFRVEAKIRSRNFHIHMKTSVPLRVRDQDQFIHVSMSLFAAGLIVVLVSLFCFVYANRKEKTFSSKHGVSFRFGVGFLIFASLLIGAGMGFYTIKQSPIVSDHEKFIDQVVPSFASSLGEIYETSFSHENTFNSDETDEYNSVSKKLGELEKSFLRDERNRQERLVKEGFPRFNIDDVLNSLGRKESTLKDTALVIFKDMKLRFDFSFFVAWFTWVLTLFTLVLACLGRPQITPEFEQEHKVPIL